MIFLLKNWRTLYMLGILLGVFILGVATGANYVKSKWDDEKVTALQEVERARKENEAVITKLEETKNENLAIIDAMRRDLMQYRVRLPKATCTGGVSDHKSPKGSSLQATGAWYVSTPAQTAFDRFTVGVGEDFTRADEIVEQCRVVMEWARKM